MDLLTRDNLSTLIDTFGEWCVSLFMPMVRAGTEVQQNPIRFRNMLRQAEDQLARLDVRVPDIDSWLEPAQILLNDPEVWRNTSDGLAVFIFPEEMTYYQLPVSFEELVVVKRRFYIKPLLPLLSGDGRFYVLALSQNQVRLLEGTRDSVNKIDLAGLPESLSEVLGFDDPERRMHLRAVGKGATGGTGSGIFQGHGGGSDTEDKQILRYFQQIDRGLRDLLADKHIPLVLAGVDYLLPIYREANTYAHLLNAGITGNPEGLSAKELHQRAWAIVEPGFTKAQKEQVELFHELAGRGEGQAATSLKDIVRAAHRGRVATLFVALGVRRWGVFRSHSYNVHVHPSQQPGDQDLLDLAAVQTFANGGVVYAVEPEDVPGGGALAAIFRY